MLSLIMNTGDSESASAITKEMIVAVEGDTEPCLT